MAPRSASSPEPFRAFEHDGWQRVPDAYDGAFGSLTPAAAAPLLAAAGVRTGTRVLDVASGPGYVAGAAARLGASAIGIDFSAAMVARARALFPAVEFREGDAESLPCADASFDAVVMNFGLLHLGRPERAVAEAHRVLRAGGRFAFTVWCGPARAVGFGIVLRAVETHGVPDVPLPPGPPFFRFSEPDECVRTLTAAGFEAPATREIPLEWRLPTAAALFDRMFEATVRTAGLLRAQAPAALAAIRAAITADAQRYARDGEVVVPMPALVASGMKP